MPAYSYRIILSFVLLFRQHVEKPTVSSLHDSKGYHAPKVKLCSWNLKNARKNELDILWHGTGFLAYLSVLPVLYIFLFLWLSSMETRLSLLFDSHIGHNVIRKESVKYAVRSDIWKGICRAIFIPWMNCWKWCRVNWGSCGIPWMNCAVLYVKDYWKG